MSELDAAHRLNGDLVARNIELSGKVKVLETALRECVEFLSASRKPGEFAGLDLDMVIDDANKALGNAGT